MKGLHAQFEFESSRFCNEAWFLTKPFFRLWDHSSLEPKYPEQLKDEIPEFIDLNRGV